MTETKNLTFNDGISFETFGPLRIETRFDGMYVVGQGMLIPVKDTKEANKVIKELRQEIKKIHKENNIENERLIQVAESVIMGCPSRHEAQEALKHNKNKK